jgi:UDP-N-acetylmuramoylalanine--D-glutamate ligase
LVLIAGGEDKDLDYSELADEIEKEVDYLFLLAGGASRKLSSDLSSGFRKEKEEKYFEEFENLLERVLKIKENFWPDKEVKLLFSPGAASFNMFKNEFDRGRKFVKALNSL